MNDSRSGGWRITAGYGSLLCVYTIITAGIFAVAVIININKTATATDEEEDQAGNDYPKNDPQKLCFAY